MCSTCPICFDDLEDKVKASPDTCDHVFCLLCIEKWSKLGSYCPVDRKRYRKIINLESEDTIQIKPRKRRRTRIVYDFSATCEICSKDDSPDTLLLCDCCDLAFHCLCLSPPLNIIPAGLWFCPPCVTVEEKLRKKKGITKEVEADLNSHGKFIDKTKKNSVKFSNLESSANENANKTLEALQDIVPVFQDINFDKQLNTSNKNSSSVSICDNDTNKVFKSPKFLKGLKIKDHLCKESTDTVSDSHRCKTNDISTAYWSECVNSERDRLFISTNNECKELPRSIEMDFTKEDISEELVDKSFMFEFRNTEQNRLYHNERKELEIDKNNCQGIQNILHKQMKIEKETAVSIHEKDFTESPIVSDGVITRIKESRHSESLVSKDMHSDLQHNKNCSEKLDKGTSFSLISNDCDKTVASIKRIGTFSENKYFKLEQEKKNQFSVFEEIEDVAASQRKYTDINIFMHSSLSTNMNLGHCSRCKDKIFVTSQNFCKICKLKYLKKYSARFKHKRHSRHTKAAISSEICGDSPSEKLSLNNNIHILDRNKNSPKKPNISALERRRLSLSQALKKIDHRKWISAASCI